MSTAPATTPLTCPAGTVLFSPGQACGGFVHLTRGRIKVSLTAPNGREVVLYRVQPGALCLQTLCCLINAQDYAAEGVAETDLEGEIVSVHEFHRRMGADAGFRDDVLRAVAERFTEYEKLVEDVALTGFDARLARALLRLAGQGTRVEATHDALAAETASGRAVVSRRLAEFERGGVLTRQRGAIEISDRAGLERIAAGDG